jgi:hypothetical protein
MLQVAGSRQHADARVHAAVQSNWLQDTAGQAADILRGNKPSRRMTHVTQACVLEGSEESGMVTCQYPFSAGSIFLSKMQDLNVSLKEVHFTSLT